jgi:pentatricopeptide repeat protein
MSFSSIKGIPRHLLTLLCLTTVTAVFSLAAQSPAQWESEIKAFENSDQTNPPPQNAVLFIGSSSIRKWTTLKADFPDHKVINRGFGGSQISDSVFFTDRIVIPYHPKLILFYAGGNDINFGKGAKQTFADFKTFAADVHRQLPKTTIAYISIAPNPARWAQVEKVKEANSLIKNFCRWRCHLKFIDVFHSMLGPDGKPRPELFVEDRLHMNPTGYHLWTGIIGPYLDKMDQPAK